MKAVLLLEDGTLFTGKSFGIEGEKCGEVVFNTSMSGYEEILTDPSYNEQIITMTYPLIGNYGTNKVDFESKKVFARGFIVKENCSYPSNFRNELSLSDFLVKHKIVGIEGIDTRKLVRHIRTKGAMRGIISSTELSIKELQAKLDKYPGLVGRDIVKTVSTKKSYKWDKGTVDITGQGAVKKKISGKKFKVTALDFGVKHNILRLLVDSGCAVTVVPANTSAKDILKTKPDGLFLSNGPGDPSAVTYASDTIKELLGKIPIFGICLGHQLLSIALGGSTYKLKFGHRGANHPVKNLKTDKIEITSQNHGFCVDINSLKGKGVKVTHMNLNDDTLEGIKCDKLSAFSVQYHPEASPGPHDSSYLFEDFIKMMKKPEKRFNILDAL